jgi:hypothetical protein
MSSPNRTRLKSDGRIEPWSSYGRGPSRPSLPAWASLRRVGKHRRFTVTAWWPSLIHWTTANGDPGDNQWRQAGEPPWGDGEVIAYVTSTGPEPAQVVHKFDIVIVDATNPSAFEFASRDLLAEADDWCTGLERALRQMIGDYTSTHGTSD